jgi:hypothetical protein
MGGFVHSGVMQHLPPNFAEDLAQVLEPSDRDEAAAIIQAAAEGLDDERLGVFFELLAERIRKSSSPITRVELRRFAAASRKRRR